MLSDRFTCQKVVIAGGIVMCVGCIISAFATNLPYLYVTFSALAGKWGRIFIPYTYTNNYFVARNWNFEDMVFSGGLIGSGQAE